MIPHNDDTRQTYVERRKESHLLLAKVCHKRDVSHLMWLQLFYYAMAEDIYGEHWDDLQRRKRP